MFLSPFQLVNFGVSLFLTVLIYLLVSPKATPFIVKEKFEESIRYTNEVIMFEDLDGDGTKEITGSPASSVNNSIDSLPKYNDHSSWYMVFNQDLSFREEPLEVPPAYSRLFFPNIEYNPEEPLQGLISPSSLIMNQNQM